jgi:hypothetical protein
MLDRYQFDYELYLGGAIIASRDRVAQSIGAAMRKIQKMLPLQQ